MPAPSPSAAPHLEWRRVVVFGSLVAVILLAANAIVCATAGVFLDRPGWLVWQVPPALLALLFIPVTLLRFRSAHPALRILYAVSATWLGALNFAFLAALACWLVQGIAWLVGANLPRFAVGTALFGLAALATVHGLVRAAWLSVTPVTVRLPGLPEAWWGRTAALVTDLHLGPLSGAGFLRRVLDRLRALRPEIVFVSGDLFDGPTFGLDELAAPWRGFSAPRGVFYVTGNHDEFAERSLYVGAARRAGLRVLDNEAVGVDGLRIVGAHDAEAGDPAELRAILRRAGLDRSRPSILLAHRPIHLAIVEEEGVSLQLSGHTHLGQMWPWSLLVRRIYGPFAYGLHRFGRLQVCTSSGAGTWGPPLRVGTRSEIVLLRFEREDEAQDPS